MYRPSTIRHRSGIERLYRVGHYDLGIRSSNRIAKDPAELSALYRELLADYPIILLEDPFAEDYWDFWTEFNRSCSIELVGDDLLVTNPRFVREAENRKACNSKLLKVNQIGTVTEAIASYVSTSPSKVILTESLQHQPRVQFRLVGVCLPSIWRDDR